MVTKRILALSSQINTRISCARRFFQSKVSVICARARAAQAQVFLATVTYLQNSTQQENIGFPLKQVHNDEEIEFDNMCVDRVFDEEVAQPV